jgi:hypothetical protein
LKEENLKKKTNIQGMQVLLESRVIEM